MTSEHDQLQQARDLIMQKQFTEARRILTGMPANDTARKWLARLDEIDPPVEYVSLAADFHARESAALTAVGLRYVVSGIAGMMAVLMIVGFFFFSWLDFGNMFGLGDLMESADVDDGSLKITAMEIWMGRNGDENLSLNLDGLTTESPAGGLAHVRLLDRFLILIPILGLVLLWLAWMYATDAMQPFTALGSMTALALVLLLFPFVWQELSEQNWKNSLEDSVSFSGDTGDITGDFGGAFFGSFFVSIFTDAYSTGEQALCAGIAFGACLLGLVVELMGQPARRTAQGVVT